MSTPKFGLRELTAGQGQPHLTWGAAMRRLDGLIARGVQSVMSINTPPANPFNMEAHIIGPSPTGIWAGKPYYVAIFLNSAEWAYFAPKFGMLMYDQGNAALVVYTGRTAGPWEYLAS